MNSFTDIIDNHPRIVIVVLLILFILFIYYFGYLIPAPTEKHADEADKLIKEIEEAQT